MERTVQTPLGPLCLEEEDGCLVRISFASGKQDSSPLLMRAEQQLHEYFSGQRRSFDLPLNPKGTPFQRKVWDALCTIPYGETRSYGQIAAQIGNPKACRAIGMANNRNPLAILIPCHRVIGANGAPVGYAGGLSAKIALLSLESRIASGESKTQKQPLDLSIKINYH